MSRHRLQAVIIALVLVAGALLLFRGGGDEEPPPPPPPDDVATAASTYALLVGVGEYPVLQKKLDPQTYADTFQLFGPPNDVALLRDVLERYLGVPAANIQSLVTSEEGAADTQPTRANILAGLDRLVDEVSPGSRVIFFFAGHGSQQPDQENGDEHDQRDEVMLPADTGFYDAATNGLANAITDDEIEQRFFALRDAGAQVLAVFDCCHSGTMLRAPAPMGARVAAEPEVVRSRGIEPELLGMPELPGEPEQPGMRSMGGPVGSAFLEEDANLRGIAAIYAASSHELAPEMKLPRSRGAPNRRDHGLCAYAVARALQFYGGGMTMAELYAHVRATYRSLPWDKATPRTEGDDTVRVLPGGDDVAKQLLLRRDGQRLLLDAGTMNGITTGSELEVFRSGRFGDESALLGRVVVAEAKETQCVLGALEGGPDPSTIPDGAPARVVHLAMGEPQLRVALLDVTGAPAPADRVRAFLTASLPNPQDRVAFPFVPLEEADWLLMERDTTDRAVARYLFVPRVEVGPAGGLMVEGDDLLVLLRRLGRAELWRRLAFESPELPSGMTITATVTPAGAEDGAQLQRAAPVRPGDTLTLSLHNQTQGAVDVVVLSFDAEQIERHVWPQGEPSRRLSTVESNIVELPLRVGDDVLGAESLIVVVAPREPTAPRLDVSAALGGTTRGGKDEDASPSWSVREFTWTTTWGRLGIPTPMLSAMTELDPLVQEAGLSGEGAVPEGGARTWRRARVIEGGFDAADVLLLQGTNEAGEMVHGLFLDADGDARMRADQAAELAAQAASGKLPAELRIVLGPRGNSAAYRRAGVDAPFGLVLTTTALSDRAKRRYELRDGRWHAGPTVMAWLSTAYLPANVDEESRLAVLAALRRFTRPR